MPENLKTMTGFGEGEKESNTRLCVQREGRLQAALPRSSSMKHGVRGAATTREPRRCTWNMQGLYPYSPINDATWTREYGKARAREALAK